jgi:prolipoprotein diacylglyceryltransferase
MLATAARFAYRCDQRSAARHVLGGQRALAHSSEIFHLKALLSHVLLEWLAYAVGGALYWRSRQRLTQPQEAWQRLAIAAGAVAGAALGSKGLYILDYWSALSQAPWADSLSGKTIVGALLGGVLGIEGIKLAIGWDRSTGDAFVAPLITGMIIGRVGCQLSDARDLTYGIPTTVAWGWDYGDGVLRHPTALYEIIGLLLIAWMIAVIKPLGSVSGDRFRALMVSYLCLRLALDFLKPPHGMPVAGVLVPGMYGGLSAIQWACVAGLAYYSRDVARWLRFRADTHARAGHEANSEL